MPGDGDIPEHGARMDPASGVGREPLISGGPAIRPDRRMTHNHHEWIPGGEEDPGVEVRVIPPVAITDTT